MSKKQRDIRLFGVRDAAEYLGVTIQWIQKLAYQHRESGGTCGLKHWQETPPVYDERGKVIKRGSALVFTQEWLDDFKRRKVSAAKSQK